MYHQVGGVIFIYLIKGGEWRQFAKSSLDCIHTQPVTIVAYYNIYILQVKADSLGTSLPIMISCNEDTWISAACLLSKELNSKYTLKQNITFYACYDVVGRCFNVAVMMDNVMIQVAHGRWTLFALSCSMYNEQTKFGGRSFFENAPPQPLSTLLPLNYTY